MFNRFLKPVHTELHKKLDDITFYCSFNGIHDEDRNEIHKQYLRQLKKIKELTIQKQAKEMKNAESTRRYSDFIFGDRVVNLSEFTFNIEELELLKKGLNYNLRTASKQDVEELGIETVLAIQKLVGTEEMLMNERHLFLETL